MQFYKYKELKKNEIHLLLQELLEVVKNSSAEYA